MSENEIKELWGPVTLDSCANCERWARSFTLFSGTCGKRGWRTDQGDYCSSHKRAEENKPLTPKSP